MFDIKKLCSPAYVYLVISVISMVMLIFQNAGNHNKYCAGEFECQVPSTVGILIGQGLYVALWTLILNSLCNSGYKNISWFLLFIPFIFFFILIGTLMLNQGIRTVEQK
jgi:hypothetical protein